jgi:hypothetical protein
VTNQNPSGVTFTPDGTGYTVRIDASREIGRVVQQAGPMARWLAVSPEHRPLGTWPSMAQAAAHLLTRTERKLP